jgi:hypothetical protein
VINDDRRQRAPVDSHGPGRGGRRFIPRRRFAGTSFPVRNAPTEIQATGTRLDVLGTHWNPGNWANFAVLREKPLEDVRNSRTLQAVYIAGKPDPARAAAAAPDGS